MAAWYLGDYPANPEVNWPQDVQGIAHDDINWFITQKSTINQIPLTQDCNVDHHGLSVGIPPELSVTTLATPTRATAFSSCLFNGRPRRAQR